MLALPFFIQFVSKNKLGVIVCMVRSASIRRFLREAIGRQDSVIVGTYDHITLCTFV